MKVCVHLYGNYKENKVKQFGSSFFVAKMFYPIKIAESFRITIFIQIFLQVTSSRLDVNASLSHLAKKWLN